MARHDRSASVRRELHTNEFVVLFVISEIIGR